MFSIPKYTSRLEGIMHSPTSHIVIITLNVYFIVNQSEKTQPINYHMIVKDSLTGILHGLAFNMHSHIISTLYILCKKYVKIVELKF